MRIASPGYFDTLGVPVRRPRTFTPLDHADAAPVVVINEAVACYWDGRDPIERR